MSLTHLLTQQQQHLETLMELLTREQAVLVHGADDGELLVQLAQQKQTQLKAIDTLESHRRGAQEKLGYAPGLPGAEQAARDTGCVPQWQAMQDIARRVAHVNQLNGTLIEQRMQHNQHVLSLLRELARDALYGQDGQQNRSGGHVSSSA